MGIRGEVLKELTEPERISIAGVFAGLCALGRRGQRKTKTLEDLFDRLEIPGSARAQLRDLEGMTADPLEFARGVHNEAARAAIVGDLLALALIDGRYDAREREGIKRIAAALDISWERFLRAEVAATEGLVRVSEPAMLAKRRGSKGRRWKIAVAVVAGGAALAITGGLAAPAIGGALGATLGFQGVVATNVGLATLGGGSLAAGGFGVAGGQAVVATGLGLAGAIKAGKAMSIRTDGLSEFGFESLGGTGLHSVVAISGWLSEKDDLERKWSPLRDLVPFAWRHVLRWESKHLLNLGAALVAMAGTEASRAAAVRMAMRATKRAGAALRWPTIVVEALEAIANPWHVAANRAEKAGEELALQLVAGRLGHQPVSLVGFSLGGRVIAHCLKHLAAGGHLGIIQNAVLLGAAVTQAPEEWRAARSVVAGRLVNVYCKRDWVLAWLYRVAELKTEAAGLGAIAVPGVTNIDGTRLVAGHLDYADKLRELLARIEIDGAVPA